MNSIEKIKETAKGGATTAAGGLLLSNPFIGIFLIGIAATLWYSFKQTQRNHA